MNKIIGGKPDNVPLTREEENAITTLKRLAKRWPKSLWLLSTDGTLLVMRKDDDGLSAHTEIISSGTGPSLGGGLDRDYIVTAIDIENDGGELD